MGTIDQLGDIIHRRKIAVVKAFGLNPETVPVDGIDIGPETITIIERRPANWLVPFIEHEFSGFDVTDEQRHAVNAYLQEFPAKGWWPVPPYPARPVKEQP